MTALVTTFSLNYVLVPHSSIAIQNVLHYLALSMAERPVGEGILARLQLPLKSSRI